MTYALLWYGFGALVMTVVGIIAKKNGVLVDRNFVAKCALYALLGPFALLILAVSLGGNRDD